MNDPTKQKKEQDWELIALYATMALTASLYVLTFCVWTIAIFIDRQPTESNLGWFGALTVVSALALTFVIAFWAEEKL